MQNRPHANMGCYYHQLSKDITMGGQVYIPKDTNLWPESWKSIEYKTYEDAEHVSLLSRERCLLNTSLSECIFKRSSHRDFKERNYWISLEEVSTLLSHSVGLNGKGELRVYPSGGARYPLETYVYINRSTDISRGLYHYNVVNNTLEVLYSMDENIDISHIYGYDWARHGAATIFLTGVFDRSMRKYGERGYRLILQESGYVGQLIYLVSAALGLHVVAAAGVHDVEVEKILYLDGERESITHTLIIG